MMADLTVLHLIARGAGVPPTQRPFPPPFSAARQSCPDPLGVNSRSRTGGAKTESRCRSFFAAGVAKASASRHNEELSNHVRWPGGAIFASVKRPRGVESLLTRWVPGLRLRPLFGVQWKTSRRRPSKATGVFLGLLSLCIKNSVFPAQANPLRARWPPKREARFYKAPLARSDQGCGAVPRVTGPPARKSFGTSLRSGIQL